MPETNSVLVDALGFLERSDLGGASITSSALKLPFDVGSEQFFEFARVDLRENTRRSQVNALSNVKRAIDCRMDSLLFAFGLYDKSKREDWKFPKKAEILLKAGVVAPRILAKINKVRNELEHEFRMPRRDETEDFLDVAHLFLSATQILVRKKVDEIQLEATKMKPARRFGGIILHPNLSLKLDSGNSTFEIALVKEPKPPQVPLRVEVSSADEENYLKILGYWTRAIREEL